MSKLEQLKKEIQRLRPEIMELKFGCVVKIDEELWQNINEDKYICLDDTQGGFDHYLQTEDYSSDSFDEILGRPITLEDVLAVLGELTIPTKPQLSYNDVCLYFNDRYKWLLGKPIDDQSEETINFIHSLIFK